MELYSIVWNCVPLGTCILLCFPIAVYLRLGLDFPSARLAYIAFLVCETGFEFTGVMLLSVGVLTSVIILIWFAFLVGVRNLPGTEALL